MEKDQYYMQKALKLAKKGEGYTSPNPMVGAVIVKGDKIIGKGYHRSYGGPHAEINALEDAGDEAQGATIYVTLEPCSHFGKTPPCSQALIKSGIKRAIIAMEDSNPRIAGRGIKELEKAGIEVKTGIMEKEARSLNEVFFKYITSDYPFVYLKTAQTLDGFLATRTGDSKWITNKKARLIGHRLRHKVDAILVGIGTVLSDNPRLTTRLPDIKGKDSIRIILDTELKIPLDAKIIKNNSPAGSIVVTGRHNREEKLDKLRALKGVEVLSLPTGDNNKIPLEKLLKLLHDRNISSILVEGGGRVNYSFLRGGFVDKIYTFIAPKIMGGKDGVAVFSGTGPEGMENVMKLQEVEYKILDDNILLIGNI